MRKGSITSSIVPGSSPMAAATLSSPTGPPSKRWITASSSLRSMTSKPSGSTSSIASARVGGGRVDRAAALDLGVVAHAAQQPVGDARRAARAPRDLGGARPASTGHVQQRRAERVTMRASSSAV
jgi:hypothetical protein